MGFSRIHSGKQPPLDLIAFPTDIIQLRGNLALVRRRVTTAPIIITSI